MLSLLAMLKLVTLKGCFHDMQQNAEQQCVKYYRNKRHIFKLALSGLPAHNSIKDRTVSRVQAIGLNTDQDYIHFTRSSTDDRDAGGSQNIRLVRQDCIFCQYIYILRYCIFALAVDSISSVGIQDVL